MLPGGGGGGPPIEGWVGKWAAVGTGPASCGMGGVPLASGSEGRCIVACGENTGPQFLKLLDGMDPVSVLFKIFIQLLG